MRFGGVTEGGEKVHDVRAGVEVVALELLEDAGVQVFGEGGVFEGVVGAFQRAVGAGVEVVEEIGEAHADFEGVGHLGWVDLWGKGKMAAKGGEVFW